MEYLDEKNLSKYLIFLFLIVLFLFLISKKKILIKRVFDSRLRFQNIFIVSNISVLSETSEICVEKLFKV